MKVLKAIISRHSENQNTFFTTTTSKEKTRAVKAKFSESEKELFSFDWMINSSLITATIKTLLVEIKQFRDYLAKNLEFAFSNQISDLSIDDNVDLNTLSTFSNVIYQEKIHSQTKNISSKHSFTERKKKFDDVEKLNKDLNLNESRKIFTTDSIENSERTYSNQDNQKKRKLSLQNRLLQKLDTSLNRSRSIQTNKQTSSKRIHSTTHSARVQSEKNFFQSSHLRNLRELFITKFFSSLLIISTESHIILTTETILSKEYFFNAFSIVFRYQLLQCFVQDNINLDFLKSIFSNAIRSRSQTITKLIIESTSTFTSQDFSISTESQENSSRLKSNEKIPLQEKITMKSSLSHLSI